MVPCVIVPTFWTRRRGRANDGDLLAVYDHPTPVDSDGTLPECLRSLEALDGLGKVVLIVAGTDTSVEHAAEDRVREMLGDFPGIDALVFGSAELGSLHRRLEQLEFADMIGGVTLRGYGAVRNVGLIVSAVLGCESALFIDDDQVVTDRQFLARALDGLGDVVDGDRVILAKTGYYVDADGRYQRHDQAHWSDGFWRMSDAFNQALSIVDAPPRMRVSTMAFGGCMILHKDMFVNVSFDPWVVRGEDVDYVINARMHGGDVFLDGQWSVMHRPPTLSSEALQFRQDVYRLIYEQRKLEFAKSQVDLRQVTPESLMPFPGEFVGGSVVWRAVVTALLRALSGHESSRYLECARIALREASEYARANCDNYFAFQRRWPIMMDRVWEDVALKSLFTGERRVDRTAITGRFPPTGDLRGDQ